VKSIAKMVALSLLAFVVWLAYDFVFDRAPPHRFVVIADREIRSAQLTLNSESKAMEISGKSASASMMFSDANGEIVIAFADGTTTVCRIGYITNGEREAHEIRAEDGKCVAPPMEV
jgi:hypothetical protein